MSIQVRLNSDWMSHIYAIDCRRVMVIIVNQEAAQLLERRTLQTAQPKLPAHLRPVHSDRKSVV